MVDSELNAKRLIPIASIPELNGCNQAFTLIHSSRRMAILALASAQESATTVTKVINQPRYTLPDPRSSQR